MPHPSRRQLVTVVFLALVVAALVRLMRGAPAPAFAPADQPAATSNGSKPPWDGPVAAPTDAPPLHDDPPA